VAALSRGATGTRRHSAGEPVPIELPWTEVDLSALDARLRAVCAAEERRAAVLNGDGSVGWGAVGQLLAPELPALRALAPARAGSLWAAGDPRWAALRDARLSPVECDILLVVLAGYLEPRYQAGYAVLQDDLGQPRPTERLLLRVVGSDAASQRQVAAALADGAPLLATGLVKVVPGDHPPLRRPFDLPPEVRLTLIGARAPAAGPVPATWQGSSGSTGLAPWVVVHGSGDRVAAVEAELDGALAVRVSLPAAPAEALAAARAAWRIGLLTAATPVLDAGDLSDADADRVGAELDRLIVTHGGRARLLTAGRLALPAPHRTCGEPTWAQRRQAWRDAVRARGGRLSAADAAQLATDHLLLPSEVTGLVTAAGATDRATLDRAALDHARSGAAPVPHALDVEPKRDLSALVLRDTTRDALSRLIHFARERDRLAENPALALRYRLDRGPVALFSGRPGTGKTLAAEAVATELRRPLAVVDLANLVSKYIGDTEKHIDAALEAGQRQGAVLLFDEADSLFSHRVERAGSAGEQFANMVVAYLLQRIERHRGVVLLSTNLRATIDEAFLRRIDFHVEFPLPDPDERERIWSLMLGVGMELAPEVDRAALAMHRLSGGEIRNAGLRALLAADGDGGVVTMAHLEEGIRLQSWEAGHIARREVAGRPPDRGQVLRGLVEHLEETLAAELRRRFLKEIHVVHGSPTDRALAGKRPAVSVALFRLAGIPRGSGGTRAGFIVSTWSHRAEEEHELLGVAHEVLTGLGELMVHGVPVCLRVQESHDFDLLHRFWSSHDHPVKASIVLDAETAA
jgi:MoxR-like ATPase